MKYIHYGHNEFDINKFEKVRNNSLIKTKPLGGFWASRLESDNGWKDYCLFQGYEIDLDNFIIFTLKEDARILTIDRCEQLNKLPQLNKNTRRKVVTELDFELLAEKYDAIEVLIGDNKELYFELYGWDVDSIFIINPNIIVLEK